jgi:myotubularin-related protein 5/13
LNFQLDVIIADIDGGSISIPESLVPPVAHLPPGLLAATEHALHMVLQPELGLADVAFTALTPQLMNGKDMKPHTSIMLDKEIRAVFMRLFAQLLQGYRSCLTLIRINPKPVITFHKAAFLGARDLIDCDFLSRVLDSMFFTGFIQERGPPWRTCDAWDELYSAMTDLVRTETNDPSLVLSHIQELGQQLYTNESPNIQQYPQKILRPPDGAFARIHQPAMPLINCDQVQAIITEGIAKNDLQSRLNTFRHAPRIVPMGCHLQSISDGRPVVSNTARRLEVLKTCVSCIFENKIADARKSFPAVMRILKQRDARLTLCRELAKTVQGNKAMLDHPQFDLVIK